MLRGSRHSIWMGTARRAPVIATRAIAATLLLAGAHAGAARAGSDAARDLGVDPASARRILENHPLRTLDGRPIRLAALHGDVVVINFWASWCAPCRHELPRLDQLNAELARRGGHVLAISIDEDRGNAERFARAQKLSLPIAHDGPAGLARELDLRHVPCTLVLDRSGDIAYASSASNDDALRRLGDVARQLIERAPVASQPGDGGSR